MNDRAASDAELARLEALARLGVLDTPAEALLDSLVRAAAAACGTPMAKISLVDARRQWIKAQVGLDGITEVPRAATVCSLVLESGAYVETGDASVDPRTRALATVTGMPHVRFYAGAPLRTPEGHVVGTLCVLDTEARTGLQPDQRAVLEELAQSVMQALLLRQAAHRTWQSASEQMFRELSEACPVGIFHSDAGGQIIYVNPEAARMFGRSRDELLASDWVDSVHPEDRDAIVGNWQRTTAAGGVLDAPYRVIRPTGEVVHIRVRAQAVRLPGGSHGGYVGSVVDVTDQIDYERELRSSNDFLARAEEIAGVGGWRYNFLTRQVIWTPQVRRIYELPDDYQPQGDEQKKYFSAEAQQEIKRTAETCMATGEPWDVMLPMVTAKGRSRWVRSIGRIEMRDGKAVALVGALQDVTDTQEARRALLESQERLHRALEGSGLALWDLDVASETIYLSETWSVLLGGPPTETICTAQELLSLVPHEDLHNIQEGLVEVLEGRSPHYEVEHRVRRRDGSLVWIHSEGKVAQRDAQGLPLRMVGTNRDISLARQAQDELRVARDAADAANRAKSQFLATMSHEIRTPLNGIIGMTKLLLDEPLGEVMRSHATLIDRSAHSLLALVNDILDVSKIEAGQMEIESFPFDLIELLDDLSTLYRLRATEKSLLFRMRVDPRVPRHVQGDPTRIRQVLVNLLGNALKFTSAGWIGLDVKGSQQDGGLCTLEFSVADTGIGIPQEVQHNLFTRFMQADSSTSRKFGGSGLGLAIVRQLVELMGGAVRFISTPEKGSRFTVTVPVTCTEAMPQASTWQELPRPDGSVRVLVAEDNTTNQVVAFGMLHKLGYENVTLANDGVQAYEKAVGNTFDLILMDCQMPEMDGYEATRRLRAAGCTAAIIAMTANAIKGDRERCLEAGMNDYLSKPIDVKLLGAMLARWAPPAGVERPSQAADLHVFSEDRMRSRFGGDVELEQVALASFRTATPPLLAKLATALAAGNRAQVGLLAHSAKGAGAMVCAERYAAVAAAIEEKAASAPQDVLERLRAELQRAFEQFEAVQAS
ncbi:PAS domain-containing protein [Ramlibacter sp. XY19]|uniref:PAS domain-containing protein n=1 Tax=Ramlibacter paludis TaxID=2908000 RepID=UPI0023DA6FCA|nr:PAS domain-containing protein [Ramlibacter paludis]MCG2595804.1 PAS domain-containing protein [Ramlibacter paludis]